MAYTEDLVVGKNAKLYYDADSDYGTPNWTLVPRVGDVSVNLGKNMGSVVTRDHDIDASAGGRKQGGLSLTYIHKKGADTVYDALQDSYFNDTIREFLILDGDSATSGNKGFRFMGIVSQLNQSQAHDDPLAYDVEIVPARVDVSGTLHSISSYVVP